MKRLKLDGFTLLELLVTLIIIGVLATLMVPAFSAFIGGYRLDAQRDRFMAGLQTARTTALTQNTPVTICARDANGDCSANATDWANGWIVFYDDDADNAVDPGEPIYAEDDDNLANWQISMVVANNSGTPQMVYDAGNSAPAQVDFDSSGLPITANDCWGLGFTLQVVDVLITAEPGPGIETKAPRESSLLQPGGMKLAIKPDSGVLNPASG